MFPGTPCHALQRVAMGTAGKAPLNMRQRRNLLRDHQPSLLSVRGDNKDERHSVN
jgi:hypothetical protein